MRKTNRSIALLGLAMALAESNSVVYPYHARPKFPIEPFVKPCRHTAHVNTSRLSKLTKKQRKNRAKSIRAKAARKKQRK